MKKLTLTTFVLTITLILASCSPQGQNYYKNSSDAIEAFQKNIKDVDTHSIKSKNETTVNFQDKKTQLKQNSYGRTNHHDKLAFNVEQSSNTKQFNTQNKSVFINSNEIQSSPKTKYLNYRAQNAEIDYYQKIGQDWFDLTTFNQSLLKPIEDDISINENTLSYEGTNSVMKYLYQLGFNQSPLVDQKSLSNINDLKIKKGKFNLTFQEDKTLPKKLTFDIVATGKIKNETINIHMKQTTQFYKFNNTDVQPYKNLTDNHYK
ncbi:hypothetical protein JTF04_01890 [Mammaliicoccus vitulinus]|uniref:hypothetical protein n=1 Tax=Mammaliicoccus vitulinus TaxID=71237 RepID=UPI0002EE011C|nr:hypothetical protein [Mammaliicoccus vitulinus]MBM6628447.1 hypothetical protein [Mammaliicoccus vitulinus]MBO3078057.1 hypothetical protein [Mammaliicoccus vitulinus]MEB7658056.1 hypothetical protein [Mammaliicoccus vitulinus]QTN11685.1 hypothetical protein G7A42_07560 [Mammaliicoccus vitulinus]WQK88819.1 hypothetical protein P3U62_04790 [Mammaliicoccus vitulinus]